MNRWKLKKLTKIKISENQKRWICIFLMMDCPWYLVVVVDVHHVPQAVTDASQDKGGHGRLGFTWETIIELNDITAEIDMKLNKNHLHWNIMINNEWASYCCTCREGELNLLIDDLHGDEVMLLVEAAVVEQQTIRLLGGKSGRKK